MRPLAVTLLAIVVLCAGCAMTPAASELVPEPGPSPLHGTNSSLTVAPVTETQVERSLFGGSSGDPLLAVDKDTFRTALVQAMQGSRLFRSVTAEPGGDYRLTAHVIAQKHQEPTLILLVRYDLAEAATGRSLWTGNVFSVKSLTAAEIFAGVERGKKRTQIVFQDNLRKLAAQLEATLAQQAAQPVSQASKPVAE